MGKKAKLKKQRRQEQKNKSDDSGVNTQDFIGQMRKEGYRLEQIQRSPEVPKEDIEPQL
jgi:hypothetical protein